MMRRAPLLLLCLTACSQRGDGPPPQTRPGSPATRDTSQPPPENTTVNATVNAPPATGPLACDTGLGDCDGQRDNGCEARFATSAQHCGSCQRACAAGQACVEARCRGGIIALAAGGSHTCGLSADGAVYCWGLNGVGQLGLEGTRVRRVATPTKLTQVRQVVAGRYHTCVLSTDARVRCFGERGQHGAVLKVPPKSGDITQVTGLLDVTHLATASNHSCAVHGSNSGGPGGQVSCWGANTRGQLGNGLTERSQVPVAVPGVDDATAVAAGNAHSCALGADRRVRCWGMNRYGQLGDGSLEDRLVPVAVQDLADVVQIDAGEFHTCARTGAGKLLCWGRNEAGQLGQDSDADHSTPQPVPLPEVTAVAVGERHVCALVSDGGVLCWGDNNDGRLGDGTRRDRRVPTRVQKLAPASSITAGGMHTCATTRDGEVLCWGTNDGQLGDGTLIARKRPVAVTGKRFVEAAARGTTVASEPAATGTPDAGPKPAPRK